MAVDLKAARDFVYQNGSLWERALFAHLFQGGSVERVYDCIRPYKNPDNGFGHGFEPDARCPDSNPIALEFLLSMMTTFGIPAGNLLDGTAAWVESVQNEDGTLRNPPSLFDYPLAPWWAGDGGQTIPDSIVGNLGTLECETEKLTEITMKWADQHLTEKEIDSIDWLFMMYHPYDFYLGISSSRHPDYQKRSDITAVKLRALIEIAKPEQYYHVLRFIPGEVWNDYVRLPYATLTRILDHLENAQQSDGSWHDEHSLPYWYPYTTILVLNGLKHNRRDIGTL